MLARWFDRSGIGQILAPDPDAAPVSENDESRSEIWQFLAPDDNFAVTPPPPRVKAPPAAVFPPQLAGSTKTPSTGFPQTPRTPASSTASIDGSSNDYNNDIDDLNARVLSACKDTSRFLRSPMPERKVHDKFLRICASTKDLPQKMMDRMRSMVKANSYRNAHLLRVRATRMGESAPDGYTAFMVAAYANHVAAAELLLELSKGYATDTGDATTYEGLHLDRDMFGMTALHIAGERGHVEMIQFLLPLYHFPSPQPAPLPINSPPPTTKNTNHVPLIDLGGQTAFGRAVTSPIPKAKKNQRTLEKSLFSKNDLSIFGETKPIESRMGTIDDLGFNYGTSDMPGLRGYMEDAMSVTTWVRKGTTNHGGTMSLFAVCDGHGDNGKVSEFLASTVQTVLDECIDEHEPRNLVPSEEYWTEVWNSTCLKLDRKIKEAHLSEGGSTGIFALVTDREIVVANVGDCRCILSSRRNTASNDANNANGSSNTIPSEEGTGSTGTGESTNEASEESAAATTATDTAASEPSQEAPSTKGSSEPPPLVEERNPLPAAPATVLVTALSEDHKPNFPGEVERIRNAGFDVRSVECREEDGTTTTIHKVTKNEKDELAISRSFGDFDYKANGTLSELEQAVIPLPGVTVYTRSPDDRYLVLACDGIWDVLANDAVIDVVAAQAAVKAEASPDSLLPDVADALLQECLGKGSRDNLTAILVCFDDATATHQTDDDATTAASPAMPAPKALDFGSPTNE